MFEQTFVEGANTTRKASSVFVSFLMQCSLVIVGVIIPLIYTETLPKTQLTGFLRALRRRLHRPRPRLPHHRKS